MGGPGMGGGGQERERSTWLAEDEAVWGTDPGVGRGVLGRQVDEEDEEEDTYDYTEQRRTRSRGGQTRGLY
jgi:hypothetical protein